MIAITLPLLGLAALGAAQSSTVSLFLPMADPQSLVASIAGSDSTATTYVVACASAAAATTAAALSTAAASSTDNLDSSSNSDFGNSDNSNDCRFPSAFTLVEGPSTVHYAFGVDGAALASVNCALSGTTFAVCTASASADSAAISAAAASTADAYNSNAVNDYMRTTTLTGNDASGVYLPVVVTAGAENAKPASGVTVSTTGSATGKSTGTATKGGSTSATSSGGATSQTSNAAVGGTPVLGAGVLGAFGFAVAGALL